MKRNQTGISRVNVLLTILMVVLLLAALVAVPMYAKYMKQTEELKNTFSHVDTSGPEIEEEFDYTEKKDVSISVGETDYPVYVRATIVITWKKIETVTKTEVVNGEEVTTSVEETVVYFQPPEEEKDYTLSLDLANGWVYNAKDRYYYYTEAVKSGGTTSILIESCKQLPTAQPPEDGYVLSVEIIAQTVQAVGYTDESNPNGEIPAYQDAWGIDAFTPGGTTEGPETTDTTDTTEGD